MVTHFLSLMYEGLVRIKNDLYDWGMVDRFKIANKVISVGNLTSGGTGKTPLIELILTYLEEKQIQAVVISRNYKAEAQVAQEVIVKSGDSARYFGDEPVMLAKKFPNCPVFIGPKKYWTAYLASKAYPLSTLLIDDGFQHRQLSRDLEIVCLDATQPLHEYEFIPFGKARDSFSELHRSDVIVLNKVNRADESHLKYLRSKIPKDKLVVETEAETVWPPQISLIKDKTIVLGFCGIGQPKNFKSEILKIEKAHLKDFLIFEDHHAYEQKDINQINSKAKSIGAEFILTTEKDFTKLWNFNFDIPLLVSEYKLKPTVGAAEFYASLDSCLHHS